MLNRLLCILISLQSQMSSSGTLVIMIPTKDGIVCSADSRTTVKGQYFDVRKKLHAIPRLNIVFTITGTATFLPAPPVSAELGEWIKKVQPLYDGAKIIQQHLLKTKPKSIDKPFLTKLSATFIQSLKSFFDERPGTALRFHNKELCRVVVAQYKPATCESTFGTFAVSVTEKNEVTVTHLPVEKYLPTDLKVYKVYGEDDYLISQVFKGKGRQYLRENFFEIAQRSKTISKLSHLDAAYLAHSMITAASRMSEIVRPKSGIGGEVQLLLIRGKAGTRIQEIKTKELLRNY